MKGALCGSIAVGPVSWQTIAQDAPLLRSTAILRASKATRGRPMRFPLALAFRSRIIRLRSSSATAPRAVKTMRGEDSQTLILNRGVLVDNQRPKIIAWRCKPSSF